MDNYEIKKVSEFTPLPSELNSTDLIFVARGGAGYSATKSQINDGSRFSTAASFAADTTLKAGSVIAGNRIIMKDGMLTMEVLPSGTTGTLHNLASPPVHLKPVAGSVGDIRMFGGVEGDGAANHAALLSAAAYYTNDGASILFPSGKWPVSGAGDIVFTQDDFNIIGHGGATDIELNGCAIKFDAVSKGSHIFRSGISNLNISRIGTAGPVVHLNGKNKMGISRFGMSNVNIKGSSAKAGVGVLAQGAWSSRWLGGSVSGCLDGFSAKVAVDGHSSANSWQLLGLEVQGNVNGLRLDGVSGIDIRAGIEGNDNYGILGENNVRTLWFHGYCEKNGTLLGAAGRDILLGNTAYAGAKNTGIGTVIGGTFNNGADAAGEVKRDCAIEITRQVGFEVKSGTTFNGYAAGAIMVNPEGAVVSRVAGTVGAVTLTGSIPETVIDGTGALYAGTKVKNHASESFKNVAAVFDPPSCPIGGTVSTAVAVAGVKLDDVVIAQNSAINRQGCSIWFVCTADDEITMYVTNGAASAKNIGASSWKLTILSKQFL